MSSLLSPLGRSAVAAAMLAVASPAQTLIDAPVAVDRDERFEREVRPLLARHCFECHGPSEQKSGLRLDHGSFIRRGGERGPAIVPGDAPASRLVRAIGHDDPELQMPPRARLADAEIARLVAWIDDGAYWPDEPVPSEARVEGFDVEARRAAHWCWTPALDRTPPDVDDPRWARNGIDRFVKSALDAAGLRPAAPAARATWLRRVTFDLIGLPPTPAEVSAFVADPADDVAARAAVVDRLLASPQYGERQARHWLDLFRYAESYGHEYDFPLHEPWRYRDHVIRAFNLDIGHDQMIREHLAGDLLAEPRRHPETGVDESVLGTASFWFMDQTHSPVDTRQALADRIDNAIDVTSKAFLGLTVACARCHDHKFDAIATSDYYAWFGVLESSRYLQRVLEPAAAAASHDALRAATAATTRGALDRIAAHAGEFAAELEATAWLHALRSAPEEPRQAAIADLARAADLDAGRLAALAEAVEDPAVMAEPTHPLFPWAAAVAAGHPPAELWAERTSAAASAGSDCVVLLDPARPVAEQAFVDGSAFRAVTDPVVFRADGTLRALAGTWLHSAAVSPREIGSLHTRSFVVSRRFLHVFAAGRDARFNVVLNGFNLIRDPIYERIKQLVDDPRPRWYTLDLDLWRGERSYLQFIDLPAPDPADPHRSKGYGDAAWIAIGKAILSDERSPPAQAPCWSSPELGRAAPRDLAELAQRYAEAVAATAAALRDGRPVSAQAIALFDCLGRAGLLPIGAEARAEFRAAVAAAEAALPEAVVALTTTDGDAFDGHVHVRGDHRSLGERVPHRDLLALGGERFDARGSGRLQLAEAIADPEHPLTARVAVNRIWHHLLGRGIVPTVDNFGVLGQRPSHPELLDWLACRFVEDGWSYKAAIRRIVLSETYAQSSSPADPRAAELDPDLALLHRARVRRLEGEVIRDAMLALGGNLDPTLYGPSVPVHLTRFMDGRGRPKRSGPLDGAGRRSIYQEVRRNFLNPMFLAFDAPIPFSTVGARSLSNVPAQALTLMNDPFVHAQAARWAERITARPELDADARIAAMYLAAFARAPSAAEREAALAFLGARPAVEAWHALAHVLWNVKEFIFLP